ncbi:hypothetical protein CVT26_013837 [Gymnopilus dilepis]|uniref:F-box domain-containing protein n=1 Tax=Gymnopilus dilepis TaxID=231916 RepID=A0A409Y5R9_9AGAR|nr:hypothetical protein CVT26_013837 [Gymnopilus dilepis]
MYVSYFESALLRLTKDAVFGLFHEFDLLSLFAVSRTSRLAHGVYTVYKQTVWNPDNHYRRWFHDVASFKELLQQTGGVVSGSFALQFFGRVHYPSSDMDIFLRAAGADDLCNWLREEGYYTDISTDEYAELGGSGSSHFARAVMNKSTFHDPLLGVYAFQKTRTSVGGREEELRVQVIIVDADPVQHIIFDFHSTGVMNFLTAFEGVSVFPWSTFVERTSYVCKIRRESEARVSGWTKKYEGRGFSVRAGGTYPAASLVRGKRSVGDCCSWTIVFDDCAPRSRGYYGTQNIHVAFEVLLEESGVVAHGSCIRVAEPYIWSFEHFLLRAPPSVICQLLQHVDILSLVSLSLTSKHLHDIYMWFAERAWDPSWRYRQWFVDVSAFRRLLRRCNAVVSGSFALQYFDRKRYVGSDMDIFLRCAGVDEFCAWLKREGYRYVGGGTSYIRTSFPQDTLKALARRNAKHGSLLGVHTFQRLVGTATGHVEVMRVQIVVVDTDPLEHILFEFHSTAVMNFLTADRAVAIFPFNTYIQRVSFVTHAPPPASKHVVWKKKYRKRGFAVVGGGSHDCVRRVVLGLRHIGDRSCWTMTFRHRGYYGVSKPNLDFEVLSSEIGIVEEGCKLKIAEPYVWRTFLL